MKLLTMERKTRLVFCYIQTADNKVITTWFFGCNSNREIIEYLKNENINCDSFKYKVWIKTGATI